MGQGEGGRFMNIIEALKTCKKIRNISFDDWDKWFTPTNHDAFSLCEILDNDWEVEPEPVKENPYVMDVKEIFNALSLAKDASYRLLEKMREGK